MHYRSIHEKFSIHTSANFYIISNTLTHIIFIMIECFITHTHIIYATYCVYRCSLLQTNDIIYFETNKKKLTSAPETAHFTYLHVSRTFYYNVISVLYIFIYIQIVSVHRTQNCVSIFDMPYIENICKSLKLPFFCTYTL